MIAAGRHGHGCKMPCESCAVQFSVFKRKRACCECERYYCSGCLRRGGGAMCAPCRALSTRPLYRNTIAHLKVRDLQCFLQRQNVSTRGCVEKEELVSLCVAHVNGAAYRRRGARPTSGAFSSLKGLTNNINDFLNNAFDLRTAPAPAPPPAPAHAHHHQPGDCYNAAHVHRAPSPTDFVPPPRRRHERFTTTPGGERDISVEVPPPAPRTPSVDSAVRDTADCFEIEDLDDAGWELVARPADPLPNDSEVLISAADALRRELSEPSIETRHLAGADATAADSGQPEPRPAADRHSADSRHSAHSDFETVPATQPRPARPTIGKDYLTPGLSGAGAGGAGEGAGLSASALELRESSSSPGAGSLRDQLAERRADSTPASPRGAWVAGVQPEVVEETQLEALSVKQLKELLARGRVEFRGCVERGELVERARRLVRARAAAPRGDDLPLEDSCKICMAAPLECVLLECGHIAACTACAKQLAECPICRQYVVRAVRFFRS